MTGSAVKCFSTSGEGVSMMAGGLFLSKKFLSLPLAFVVFWTLYKGWRMTGSAVKCFSTSGDGVLFSTGGLFLSKKFLSLLLSFFLSWFISPDRRVADFSKLSSR